MVTAPPDSVALVPELDVSDLLNRSLQFYVDLIDFVVLYDRPESGFAFLGLGGAHLMLQPGSKWKTAPLEAPYGRGINFQIEVDDLAKILKRLEEAPWPLFAPIEERWYRRSDEYLGQRQFLAQDPDGYLLRFRQRIGLRATVPVA